MLRSAYLTLSHSELVRVAHPHFDEFEVATLESVVLTVPTDQGPLIVDAVLTSRAFKPEVAIGSIMEGVTSAHSKIFLAFRDQSEKDSSLSPQLRLAASVRIDAQELARIKRQGVAYDLQEWSQAKAAIAAPVFDSSGHVNASLAIIWPSERLGVAQKGEFPTLVKEAAVKLSEELGYRTPPSE